MKISNVHCRLSRFRRLCGQEVRISNRSNMDEPKTMIIAAPLRELDPAILTNCEPGTSSWSQRANWWPPYEKGGGSTASARPSNLRLPPGGGAYHRIGTFPVRRHQALWPEPAAQGDGLFPSGCHRAPARDKCWRN
jgi:hypothetical protein